MKKTTELLLKCLWIIAPLIGICIFARMCILGYADNETPYYLWNKKVCNESQEKTYNVLILGDSASNAAYAPELLADSVINLALGGTTPVENYYILKEYLDHNDLPQVIYMSFNDTHLTTEDVFYNRIMYTHRFDRKELLEIMERAGYYNEPSIMTDTYLEDFWSYELYLPTKYITSIMNARFNQRLDENKKSIGSVGLHKGRYISLRTVENAATDPVIYSEFRVAALFDEYYRRIIELCADKGITVHVVKLPLDENVVFTEAYENQFYTYYRELRSEYSNLTVDWIRDSYGHFYFADLVHMNNRGARKFSSILKTYYPKDFAEEIADVQYDALDDDIRLETSCKELFQWICDKEYTIIMYDGTGDLEQIYTDELQLDTGMSIQRSVYEKIYYVSGVNRDEFKYELEFSDEGYKIMTENGIYGWTPLTENGIGICVMNDRSSVQVCEKNYERVERAFYLQ